MASSPNFDLKEELDKLCFKDPKALNSLCKSIASKIESGSLKLCAFVEILGSYMTDQNVQAREKGVRVLSSVLSQLPQDHLTESELHFITTFYCDRMKDHYSIIPSVLNGVLAIVKMSHLPQDAPSSILRNMFEHVQCQSQLLAERHNIYLIFKHLIENRPDYLRSMGPDLVYGIINSIDGERDPRTLMLLFDILPRFIKEFPLGHLTEEMFEVMACYFPVDFNPSGKEDVNVTRDDLAKKLAPCLYAIPEFADYCIPLILDKSYSTLRVAKLDSLTLLRDGAKTFGLEKMKPYLPDLWTTLKKEVVPGRDDAEIKDVALEALTSLVTVISVHESTWRDFIDRIISDLRVSLSDVQLSLYKPSQKLLEAAATVSKPICVQILQAVVPLCIGQYSSKNSLNDKITLIETLNDFMKICTSHNFCIQDIPELTWTNIPQIYLHGLTVENIELKSKMFLGLTIQRAYLNDAQRSALYNVICNEIETGCDEVQSLCHRIAIDFAVLYPHEISLLVKERLLLFYTDEVEVDLMKRRIKALLTIAELHELGCVILPKVVAMLTNDVNADVCATILLNVKTLIASKTCDFNVHQFLYKECHIIDRLFLYETSVVDRKMLICNLCQLIVRNLTIDEQRAIVARYAAALNTKIPKTDVAVIMSLLVPLRSDIRLDVNSSTVENLYNLAISSGSPDIRQTTCAFLSVLLNKMETVDLDRVAPYFEDAISNNLKASIDVELKRHTVHLQIWITKALVTRGHARSQYFLENLTHLLAHDEVGAYVAEQYQILVSKDDDILVTENFCNVRIFYKQRVFEYLLRQNGNFTTSSRQNYLIALVHLLEQVPEDLLFFHLAKVVPLLIESLSLSNEHLVFWALTLLKILLNTKHDVFSDNVQCVIPRLLQLLTFRLMDIRIAALQCLAHYANYPTILINPYKQDVLDKLSVTLDDRKRLVRKAAVEARTRWFLVGSQESKN